jgi:hypothetical protein
MDKESTKQPTDKVADKVHTVADLKSMAHDYAVPLSDGTMDKIAKDGLTPEKVKAFEDYIKTTAMGLYPTLATQIKAGIPTAYLLDPYRQVAKQMLGEDHEPNFASDPKAEAALSGGADPATGRPAPMSLDQWKGHIRSHPGFGWGNTPAAHEQANATMQAISQQMLGTSGGQPGVGMPPEMQVEPNQGMF